MSTGTLSQAAFDRIGDTLVRALTGLSPEQLRRQPAGPDSNPIGWMTWHLSRGHDRNFSTLLGKEPAWVTDGWHERFRLPSDIGGGGGATIEEVRAFDPIDAETLIGYWLAARTRSRELLDAIQDSDLDRLTPAGASRVQNEAFKGTIARMMSDAFQHIGQVCYVRGLVDRPGWYGS